MKRRLGRILCWLGFHAWDHEPQYTSNTHIEIGCRLRCRRCLTYHYQWCWYRPSYGQRLTHPGIHVDFYSWLKDLPPADRAYLETAKPMDLAMWVWSRGRETVVESQKQSCPQT